MTLIVLDTNVLVSALLNPFGPPGRVLDLILDQSIRIAYDDRILTEYLEVLNRPRFGFQREHVQEVVSFMRLTGVLVGAHWLNHDLVAQAPDPDDLPFAEVAVAGQVDALVTGNQKHYRFLAGYGIPVLGAKEFLDSYP